MTSPAIDKLSFTGEIQSVKGRIRMLRSFDQLPNHQYLGYLLQMKGTVGHTQASADFRVAIGPKAHETFQFRIGDHVCGVAHPVSRPDEEWADFYKVSGLKLLRRGPDSQNCPPNPDGGIPAPLPNYRERGHFRLDRPTFETRCQQCPWGLIMPTTIILDQWNPSKVKTRLETHCYGPHDCPRYKAGPPYRVQGRKPGMVYIDDDVERAGRV